MSHIRIRAMFRRSSKNPLHLDNGLREVSQILSARLCQICRKHARKFSPSARLLAMTAFYCLVRTQPRPLSNLSLCRISRSFILLRMDFLILNFQSDQVWCWELTRTHVTMAYCRSARSSDFILMPTS